MKKLIYLLFLVLSVSMLTACGGSSDGGSGSKNASNCGEEIENGVVWIKICTAEQLNAVRNNLAGNYRLMNDISLAGYSNWQPIGGYIYDESYDYENNPEIIYEMFAEHAFSGKFNGNGYKITDLTIYRPTEMTVGLFGAIYLAKNRVYLVIIHHSSTSWMNNRYGC